MRGRADSSPVHAEGPPDEAYPGGIVKWPGKPRTGANPDEEIRPNGDLDTQASRSVRRGWPYLLVFVAVILANSVYLIGYTQFDPLIGRAGVAASITPGLVAGSNTIDPNDGFTAQA